MTRNIDHRRLGRLRQDQGEIANHIIDEFAAGRLSRRDFVRRATVVGISVPALGSILAACGSSSSSFVLVFEFFVVGVRSAPGAVIKAGIVTPTAAINPVTVADQGGLDMLAQTGEYLCLSGAGPDPAARYSPPAGRRTPTPPSGHSRSARGSSSTTAPR